MKKLIELKRGKITAKINPDNGQLVSLSADYTEYFHRGGITGYAGYKGNGWRNSEIVPFPIFGPAPGQKVRVGNDIFYLEQHGISRYLKFMDETQKTADRITLIQEYGGFNVVNPKYTKENGHPKHMKWLPYTLEKTFELTDNGLVCELKLTNGSDVEMPYMIGWHPAFKTQGSIENGVFIAEGREAATLENVIKASVDSNKGACYVLGQNTITYLDKKSGVGVKVSSNDFGKFVMLWSPGTDSGMFCIEHSSQIPGASEHFADKNKFELLKPGETKKYRIVIELLAPHADNPSVIMGS
jgi:galactose mutarotase-like enzyme